MTNQPKEVITIAEQNISNLGNAQKKLTRRVVRLNALACNNYHREDFDIELAMKKSQDELTALNAAGGLQEMLAAQMLSIHRLQQLSIAMVTECDHPSFKQYLTNASIKLANTFTQQANLLSRLQGNGGQKIIVEHLDIHDGGQAVVGHITGGRTTPHKEEK